jgi:hypothetical protein
MVHVVRILPLAMLLIASTIVVWRGFDDRSPKARARKQPRRWRFWR